jgi:uncharacterized membrane protein
VLSRGEPWSLTRLSRVPRGTSGAVSPLGVAATVAGALAVGVVAAASVAPAWRTIAVAVGFGTAGALGDSVLGATVQERYRCEACARDGESEVHHCGARGVRIGGVRGFGNDWVNAVATFAAAAAAALLS